jgi:hypothetical protein
MPTPEELLARSIDLVKDAYKTSKKTEANGEITEALMEVREHLQLVRESFGDLRDQTRSLAERVRELEQSLEASPELVRSAGVYWKKNDPDPWCPICYDKDQRTVHLNATAVLAGRLLNCPVCNFDVNRDNVQPPKKWPG